MVYVSKGFTPIFTSELIYLNKWYHVAFTLNAGSYSIYVNGVLEQSLTSSGKPSLVTRQENTIGKAWYENPIDAIYSDIKINNGSLTSNEIMEQYNEFKPLIFPPSITTALIVTSFLTSYSILIYSKR